eukprot:1025840_1
MAFQDMMYIIFLTIIIPSLCQNCYPQNTCNYGYMDKTNGNMRHWECGASCPGLAYYTDGVCGCACIPEESCNPTKATLPPTTSIPTQSTQQPTPLPTTTPTAVPCYPRGACKFGYMDKTEGDGQHWECGDKCEGKEEYTDYSCNCACITAPSSCAAASDIAVYEKMSFWIPIGIGVVVLCICYSVCTRRKSSQSYSVPNTQTPSNNWNSATPNTQTPVSAVAMQPMQTMQQQLPVVFVTPGQMQQQFIYAVPDNVPNQVQAVAMPLQTPQNDVEALPSYADVTEQSNQREGANTYL